MVFGVHAADTTSAGARQVWTGQEVHSMTQQGSAALRTQAMSHPHLAKLFSAYLNQDCSLYGDTLEAVIDAFLHDASPQQVRQLREDIAAFRHDTPHDADAAFAAHFGADFDPAPWEPSVPAFLDLLDGRLGTGG